VVILFLFPARISFWTGHYRYCACAVLYNAHHISRKLLSKLCFTACLRNNGIMAKTLPPTSNFALCLDQKQEYHLGWPKIRRYRIAGKFGEFSEILSHLPIKTHQILERFSSDLSCDASCINDRMNTLQLTRASSGSVVY